MTKRISFQAEIQVESPGENASMSAQIPESTFVRLLALATILAASVCAVAQAPPILNSPYVCPNGITYTVTTCKPYRVDQWCETVEKQNGNLVTSMDSAWSSMTGRLRGCTNAASTASSSANTSGAATSRASTATMASGGTQQTLNPPYLKEFPTVDQVMAQMKGIDGKDTANRQMGAFEQFKKILQDLAGSRWLRGQLTPDESRILGTYALAYDNLAKPLNYPDDGYFANPDFVATLFNTFPIPTVKQQWLAQNAAFAARVKGSQQRQINTTASTDTSNAPRPLPPTNDPAQIAIRRCFELGGTGLQCVSSGMSEGLKQFMGIDLGALTGSAKPGLVILGTYTASSGLSFAFNDKSVDIGSCGLMVKGSHNYSVSVSGGKYVVNIANQPQALVLTLGSDGKASGPAAQDITGQKVTGYTVWRNTKTGVIDRRDPIYAPITVHCNIGALAPGAAVAVDPGLPSSTPSVISAIGTVLDTLSGNGPPKQLMLPPGPRMTGVFANQGGMKIQFNDGSAIVDCARAHILTQYNVSSPRAAGVVAVTNGSNPFDLKVQPDGTLSGSGTTTISGKLMTALSGADPVFASTSASCPLNMLTAAK